MIIKVEHIKMMRISLILLVASFCLGFSSCQGMSFGTKDFQPCCMPDESETSIVEVIIWDVNGRRYYVEEVSRGAFDFRQERVGLETEVLPLNGTKLFFRVIDLYREDVRYVIMGNNCSRTRIGGRYRPHRCISDSAVNDDSFFIGVGSSAILVNDFRTVLNGSERHSGLFGVSRERVMERGCIPIGHNFVGEVMQEGLFFPVFIQANYVNYTLTIRDPARWFTVPPSCRYAPLADESFILQEFEPIIQESIKRKLFL